MAEQRRIVAAIEEHLSRIDAGTPSLERVRVNLKRFRAAVLKAAIEGRLTERWREENPKAEPASELLERILKERRERWKEEQLAAFEKKGRKPPKGWQAKYKEPDPPKTKGLPRLPQGWTWVTWNQVGASQNGRAFPSKEYSSSGVKLLRPGNLHVDGSVQWTEKNTRYLPIEWSEDYPSYLLGSRELVINLTAQSLADEFLGRVCLTSDREHCLLNQRIARLTPIMVLPNYLLWMFKSHVFRRYVEGLNTGSLIQHMFVSQIAEFAFPLPPLDEQRLIAEAVEQHFSVLKSIESTIEASFKRAARLRQSVLKRAFEGRLVPQDPSDEPADELLARIRAERERNASGKRRGGGKPEQIALEGNQAALFPDSVV